MEDEATQPTQAAQDPRRLGRNNSGLAHEDISDSICILHPCSPAAFKIVAHTAVRSPQNVLQTHSFDDYDDGVSPSIIEEQETFILGGSDGAAQAMDLALRFSTKVIRPHLGFVFGRSAAACDIVVDTDTIKRVSNVHFRIFVNDSGVLMLEDMSTNGTVVDDVALRSKIQPSSATRMLSPGSIIQILSPKAEELVKFIVRIPNREGHEDEYQARFFDYMRRMAVAEANARHQTDQAPVVRRLKPAHDSAQSASHRLNLKTNQHGMHWSGGDKYNVVASIGRGAFATVYQIATKSDGHLFAAKELEKRRFMKNGVLDRKIDNEMQIMKAIHHRNVVQYVEYYDIGSYLYIVMEFVPCGDLNQYIHGSDQPRALPESMAKQMSAQVFDALDYLHKKKITHRDIKPDNILIADLDPLSFTIKLSDFGLSKVVKDNETFLKTFCGTLLYCAPEVFPHYDAHVAGKGNNKRPRRSSAAPQKFHSYSQSVDIWSYGAVLWYSLCVRPPFEGVADNTGRLMFEKIMMTPLDATDLVKQGVSDDAVSLLMEMLNTDPAFRPTPAYCMSHSWFGNDRSTVAGATEIAIDTGLAVIAEEHEHDIAVEPDVSSLSLDEHSSGQNSQNSEISLHSRDMDFFDPRKSKRFKSEAFAYRDRDGSLIGSSPEVMFDNIPIVNQAELNQPKPQASTQPKLFGEISQSALQSSNVFGVQAGQALGRKSSGSRESNDGQSVSSAQHAADTKGALASPSLLGAESLVRDLHMDSPNRSGSSPAGEPIEPTTPDTPSRAKAAIDHMTPNDITPKPLHQPTFNRRINLPITPSFFYDASDPSTHNLDYASKASGFDFHARPHYYMNEDSLLDTTCGSRSTDRDDERYHTDETTQEDDGEPELLPPAQFVKPPPRLGRLVSTPDSYVNETINLTSRTSTWGRALGNSHVYKDGTDTRIGKRTIILVFHAKDIDTVPDSDDGWTKLPGLTCNISTETVNGIWINGVHLEKSQNGVTHFGCLHTGDVVEVVRSSSRSPSVLRFVVELFHGVGKQERTIKNAGFEVKMQAAHDRESQAKSNGKSRMQGSPTERVAAPAA